MENRTITLRKFTTSDVDDYMTWASDPAVTNFCRFDPYTSKSDLLAFITTTVLSHPYFKAICVDSKLVGGISVSRTGDICRGELGYVLAKEYWGKGIASDAVRLVLKEVFDEMPELERVEALVDVENLASQRVLEKVGFVKEGVLRKYGFTKGKSSDMVIFSFLNTDVLS